MFKEMRRRDRAIVNAESIEILNKCSYGILSTTGTDGYAYGVPLSYVYIDNTIYFHSATEGQKIDNLSHNNKVSFCVVGDTCILPDKFSTKYESVIVYGQAIEVHDEEKHKAMIAILNKYSKDFLENGEKYLKAAHSKIKVIKISIDNISGKANK